MVHLDIGWQTAVNAARTSVVGGVGGVGGVSGVEPEHVGEVIVPEGHHQHQTLGERAIHILKASALCDEVGAVLSGANPIFAELLRDGIVVVAQKVEAWLLNLLAVLVVVPANFVHFSIIRAVVSVELGDNSHWLLCVERELFTRSVERPVAHASGS